MATVAIHQPNYLPGLTYFDRIAACDVFVLLDHVQFTKGNWTNRNRIKTANGAQWLTVPVLTAGRLSQRINETVPDQRLNWPEKHLRALQTNYGKAPHFKRYAPLIEPVLTCKWPSLADLNAALIEICCQELGITVRTVRSSSLSVEGSSTDLLVNICSAVGGDAYLSGPGGMAYMDPARFEQSGIALQLREFVHPVYRQLHGAFEANLSAVDLLFNEGDAAGQIIRASGSVTRCACG